MEDIENDWRMQDIFYLNEDWKNPWTGEIFKKGTQLTRNSITQLTKKKQLSIALPNATALFLNSSKRSWESAKEIGIVHKCLHLRIFTLNGSVTVSFGGLLFDFSHICNNP